MMRMVPFLDCNVSTITNLHNMYCLLLKRCRRNIHAGDATGEKMRLLIKFSYFY